MDESLPGRVRAAQGGDASAFAGLVESYSSLVRAIAARWDGIDPDDIIQDTFIDAFLQLGRLEAPEAFIPWLRRIAWKHCDRATRRRPPGAPEQQLPPADDPESEAAALVHAVNALPASLRLAVALSYFSGAGQVEVAAFLGLPLSALKARLRRARTHLRRSLTMANPEPPTRSADERHAVTHLFAALRAADAPAVRRLLAARPGLANSYEEWDAATGARERLGFAQRGTPLIRAIERGDIEIVRAILDAGADVDGECGCEAGERPVWTAAVHARTEHVRLLLARGADPNVRAFRGATPLHVAAMRGDAATVEVLLGGGAEPVPDDGGRTPAEWAAQNGHVELAQRLGAEDLGRGSFAAPESLVETGIKVIDLFAPLRLGGLTRVVLRPGLGAAVLLAEVSARMARMAGRTVVWTGFDPAPLDRGDLAHFLAESGIADIIRLAIVDRELPAELRREALLHVIDACRGSDGAPGFLILFEESGLLADTEACYLAIAKAGLTALVVSPIDGQRTSDGGAPFSGVWHFDAAMAKRANFPALDVAGSTGAPLPRAIEPVAAQARGTLRESGPAAAAIEAYLTQPFFTTEPFTSTRGQWVSAETAAGDIARILADPASFAPADLRYRGAL